MKVPFGLHKDTNQYIGIDEAKNGLNCECICPSCEMELKARQGDENEHHFAHHKKAKEECEFSYWVSVRSMARQLIEQYKYIHIDFNKDNLFMNVPSTTLSIFKVKIKPFIKSFQFDLEVISSIGIFYVYFITDEEDIGRYREHYNSRHKYFEPKLILEINLSSIRKCTKNIRIYLNSLLFEQSFNKFFLTPKDCFVSHRKLIGKEKDITNDTYNQEISTFYKKQKNYISNISINKTTRNILQEIDLKEINATDKTIKTINNMLSFYYSMDKNINKDRDNINSFESIYKEDDLFYVGCCGEFYCIAYVGLFYIAYTVENDNIILTSLKNTSFAMLCEEVEKYINKYIESMF